MDNAQWVQNEVTARNIWKFLKQAFPPASLDILSVLVCVQSEIKEILEHQTDARWPHSSSSCSWYALLSIFQNVFLYICAEAQWLSS